MSAISFESAQAMSDYQAAQEVQEALRVQQMVPTARFAWLEQTWGRLQNDAVVFFTDVQHEPASARCYATLDEKNRFDQARELRQALQIHLARQI